MNPLAKRIIGLESNFLENNQKSQDSQQAIKTTRNDIRLVRLGAVNKMIHTACHAGRPTNHDSWFKAWTGSAQVKIKGLGKIMQVPTPNASSAVEGAFRTVVCARSLFPLALR